jgi:iron complex outermembrane receptor protein
VNLGLRLSRFLGTVGAALLFARSSSAQPHACKPNASDADPTAQWPAPLDRLVTVPATRLSLRDALDRVGAIAKIRLSYSSDGLPLDRAVCLSADGDPAGKILAELTAGTSVVAIPAGGDQVALAPRQQNAPAPQAEQPPEMLPSLGVLDRVVVTGSAVPAPERELTVDVSVVSGRQLARENTNTLSSALDSYVPGLWSWTQSPVSMLSSYASIRGASSFGLSYPKIYIDGIEVANPLLVSRFAPEAIDHVEVIRGPQGSALYGADAISGVVNIVSRHDGASREGDRGSVRSSAGVTQSAFSRNVLSQQHDVSLFAGSSTGSADLHVSGGTTGAFIPNAYSRDLLANGSARYVGEKSTVTATARFFAQEAGSARSPLLDPRSASTPGGLAEQNTAPQSVREYTVGTNATYAASELWTHSIVAGIDGYRLANVESSFTPIPRGADSALRAAQGRADRATIRATSILNLRGTEPTRLTLTMSAEHSALHEVTETRSMAMSSPQPGHARRSGYDRIDVPVANAAGFVTDQLTSWQSSTGLTGSASAALDNTVFLTGGLRVEHDSRLPTDNDIALLPMLGLATVHEVGPATIKLRAAYGEGIRPPSTVAHSAFWQTRTHSSQNSLGAERQSGIESGIDVMFDRALSLKITHFDQHASGLIQQVMLPTDGSTHGWEFQLENVGEISNRGWELEAQTGISRLSITGTMSFVDSRVERLADGYTGDLRTGDRMLQVPARTGSLNLAWLGKRWHASVSGSRAFNWINYDELALSEMFLSGTHPGGEMNGARLRQYWRDYTGSLHVRATASRDFFDRFSFELTGENLLGHQLNEPDNVTVLPGRTVTTGVRLKF